MTEDFQLKIRREDKARHVSELPFGVIADVDRTLVLIPECCREGWESCPHVPKKFKPAKRNIGL